MHIQYSIHTTMNNRAGNLRRIHNEVKELKQQLNEESKMFMIDMIDDNIYHWRATLFGPTGSLYEGYEFEVDIKLPDNYPYSPLTVKFITKIQHVNVNNDGDICLNVLKTEWTPSQTIYSILISLILLMSQPNPDDPFNSDLAELYRTNKHDYEKKIKRACNTHAKKRT
jgi:ubiquitin-protein ligase